MSSDERLAAHEMVMHAAVRVLSAQYGDVGGAYYAAEIEYADEQLEIAARALYLAVTKHIEERPDSAPVGWGD